MSTSYSAGVVLGVKLDELGLKVENISVQYEVHDKKGKPTGKIEYEKSWKINFQGKETVDDNLYSDVVEELLGIKKPLELLDISYDKFNVDKVVGINIVDRDYDDWNVVKEISIDGKLELVKSELKKQFGVDVEPKLYFYFEVS
jgi:hypothetical protein